MKLRAGFLGLVALLAVLGVLASGSTLAQAETRVRASSVSAVTGVRDFRPSAANSQLGNGQSYDGHASVPVLAAEGADHVVFGKALGLEDRAAQIGGRHLMNETDWQGAATRAIGDPSTKISVALDDVQGAGSTYSRVMSAVQRSASGRGSPFDWEMQQLHEAGRLSTTDFWEGGQVLENPFG